MLLVGHKPLHAELAVVSDRGDGPTAVLQAVVADAETELGAVGVSHGERLDRVPLGVQHAGDGQPLPLLAGVLPVPDRSSARRVPRRYVWSYNRGWQWGCELDPCAFGWVVAGGAGSEMDSRVQV